MVVRAKSVVAAAILHLVGFLPRLKPWASSLYLCDAAPIGPTNQSPTDWDQRRRPTQMTAATVPATSAGQRSLLR